MADEKNNKKNTPENASAKEDIFSEPVKEQPSQEDIFSADEELSRAVQDELKANDSDNDKEIEKKYRLVSTVEKILASIIIGIAILVSYFLIFGGSDQTASGNMKTAAAAADRVTSNPKQDSRSDDKEAEVRQEEFDFPISLKSAETLYKNGNYKNAYIVYEKLSEKNGIHEKQQLIGDYIKLRMGLCASAVDFSEGTKEESNFISPEKTFRQLSQSQSPIVRITAYCNLSRAAHNKGNHLSARSYVYKILALSSLTTPTRNWHENLIQECEYASAEQLTRKIISLSQRGDRIPEDIWQGPAFPDALSGKDISEIENILQQGRKVIANQNLLPKIEKVKSSRETSETAWKVSGSGVSVDDFFAKVGRTCGINIEWDANAQSSSIKNRTVSIYTPEGTAREIITTAAGSAGLLVYKINTDNDKEKNFRIYNPREYKELDSHITILAGEAERLWQQFLLKTDKPSRKAMGHFCLGTLYAERRLPIEAIVEYQLVYNNYPYSKTAPAALMESSRIKTDLKDYEGAREDLTRLVEQFPDSSLNQQANLYLGRESMETGDYRQAYRSFKKVYYFAENDENALESAFSAAKCRYHLNDIESAKIWINRYLKKADKKSSDFYRGWYLAGLCYSKLGEERKADIAFRKAVSGRLPADQYLDAVKKVVEMSIRNGEPIQALGLIKEAQKRDLPREHSIELLRTKAGAMAEIGLINKAIDILNSNLRYVTNRELKAKLLFDLGKYQAETGNLRNAKSCFVKTINQTESPELIRQSNLELAKVHFETGETGKTIELCSKLLDTGFKKELQNQARRLMIKSYNKRNEFDKAIELIAAGENNKQFSRNLNNTSPEGTGQQENITRN